MARHQRLGRRKTPPNSLVKQWIKRFKSQPNGVIVDHRPEPSRDDPVGESLKPKKYDAAIQLFINSALAARYVDER